MDQALLNALKDGGNILYVRHGEATVGEDEPNLDFRYCFTQRNLSGSGKMQAINYGNLLRSLQIPLSYPIEVSPYCRTIETGLLAFGGQNIQVEPVWMEVNELNKELPQSDKSKIITDVKSKLEIPPPDGMNKLVIAHSFPKGIELGEIGNLETVVIKPLGKGNGYQVIGRFTMEEINNSINRYLNAEKGMFQGPVKPR